MRQRFIQSFPTSDDIQTALDNKELGDPYVAYQIDGQRLIWNVKDIDHILPLTFEVTDAGTIIWKKGESNAPARTIQYSINNGSWQSITANDTAGTEINVSVGDVVRFKGNNTSYALDVSNSCRFAGTAKYYAYGNIMSLIYGDNFIGKTTLTETYTFTALFYQATGLKSHSTHKLILPATTLTDNCYNSMFYGCHSLAAAPELPATTLATHCYEYMFRNCISLTKAPELPATELASYCYSYMFRDCPSLTTAPALPATTLAINCYQNMFATCDNLIAAPALPATTLADSCYEYMFFGCNNLIAAPSLPAKTLAKSCYESMFGYCKSLTQAPELPATTLASNCYQSMFQDCTSLTKAPELPATTLASYCYRWMFSRCTKLNYIKCLATDISATNCTTDWVNNVASSGSFYKHPNATWTTGTSGIPTGWTVSDAVV